MNDIQSKEDIDLLISLFYGKVFEDELLSPFFKNMNFESHKPQMVHFWSFALIDEPGYKTNVTEKHLSMPLEEEHFERWISYFKETVSENFSGEIADKAIQRAKLVGWTIQEKLKHKRL